MDNPEKLAKQDTRTINDLQINVTNTERASKMDNPEKLAK